MIFEKRLHRALWGEESWEISAHRTDPSPIVSGSASGRTLRDVFPEFPLLVKVIDAKTRLSVQVHPNETTCQVTGGEPKSEMWCALSDGPIYAGLKPGTGAADIAAAVASGCFEELLVRHEAKAGDVFYIPGGLVHAIGDGVRLYEVQQSSDTTFRLYDWGRVGADGKPRELHVAKALEAVDYGLKAPVACRELDTPFFRFKQARGSFVQRLETAADEFLVIYLASGGLSLEGETIRAGTSVLLPPATLCQADARDAWLLLTRVARRGL